MRVRRCARKHAQLTRICSWRCISFCRSICNRSSSSLLLISSSRCFIISSSFLLCISCSSASRCNKKGLENDRGLVTLEIVRSVHVTSQHASDGQAAPIWSGTARTTNPATHGAEHKETNSHLTNTPEELSSSSRFTISTAFSSGKGMYVIVPSSGAPSRRVASHRRTALVTWEGRCPTRSVPVAAAAVVGSSFLRYTYPMLSNTPVLFTLYLHNTRTHPWHTHTFIWQP